MVNVTQTDVDILMLARDIISEEGNWCQGASARNRLGQWIGYTSDNAASFCSVGAVCRAAFELEFALNVEASATLDILDKAHILVSGQHVPISNDNHNHQFALDRFDDAIRMAKDQL